jgi:hypothetical protein
MSGHRIQRPQTLGKDDRRPFPADWRERFLANLEENSQAGRLLDLNDPDLLKVGKAAMIFLLNPQSLAYEREKREKQTFEDLRRQGREIAQRIKAHPTVFRDLPSFLNCSFLRDVAERQRIESRLEMVEKVFDSRTPGLHENHYYLFGLREFLKDKCELEPTRYELSAIVTAANAALSRPESKEPLDPDSLIRKLHRFDQNRPLLLASEDLRLLAVKMIENLPI